MVVHRDLFGGASLIQESGYIGDAGQIKIDHHPDEGAAVDALALMAAKKRRQGYLEG
jgi:predicted DNA-binding WGR domain protein